MAKKFSKGQRHDKLTSYVKTNPFLTDEELALLLGVSVQTIRLDRATLKIPELRERIMNMARGKVGTVKSLSHEELFGELVGFEVGKKATSILAITKDMVFKKNLVARGHHLFAQANSLAVALIDAAVALTGSAKVSFRRPVKLGDRVIAKAKVTESRENRHVVSVISQVKDIVVFEGLFTVFAIAEEA